MRIAIIYGSNSSGTKEVSRVIRSVFVSAAHTVDVYSAAAVNPAVFDGYDLIIFGSCTWELITPAKRLDGQLQQHFLELQSKLKGKQFIGKRFAVFGLGDSSYTHFCAAADHLLTLVESLRGQLVGQALRVDSYFFDQNENDRKVQLWARAILRAVDIA